MKRTVPLILAVALFMENMDSTVIATSLPAIAVDIGTSPIALKLALTAYLVSLAIFIPISSWIADHYGAKRVFRIAIGVFVIGSIACAMAGSLPSFVVARFLQGVGGAMMTPVARLLLVRTTSKRELVSAMAWLSMPALIGPLVGPPVGGFITTFFTWHWIFIINVPIGVLGIWLAGIFLPETPPGGARPLDVTGFFLSAIGASGVVFGLSVISLPALPPIVGIVTLIVGIIAAVVYVFHARRVPNPILDFRLLRNPVFRAAIVGGSVFRMGSGATPFLLPLMFQLGFGMTPFESGLLTCASAVGALSMKLLAPFTLRAGGFRTVLIGSSLAYGAIVAANGLFTPSTPHGIIVAVMIGSGFLRSLSFTSTNALVFADIEGKDAGQATAISAAMQQITIAIGVSIAGGILETMMYLTGAELDATSFSIAFFIVGAITALSALTYIGMAKDAGSSVSGHRLHGPASEQPPVG